MTHYWCAEACTDIRKGSSGGSVPQYIAICGKVSADQNQKSAAIAVNTAAERSSLFPITVLRSPPQFVLKRPGIYYDAFIGISIGFVNGSQSSRGLLMSAFGGMALSPQMKT
jgi:hypothetical protein